MKKQNTQIPEVDLTEYEPNIILIVPPYNLNFKCPSCSQKLKTGYLFSAKKTEKGFKQAFNCKKCRFKTEIEVY